NHVLGDVCRAAKRVSPLAHMDDWYRSLRRDPLDVADEVLIEHGVAHHDDPRAAGRIEQRVEAVSADGERHGGQDKHPACPLPPSDSAASLAYGPDLRSETLSELILRLNAQAK